MTEHVFMTESGELVVINEKAWTQWEYNSSYFGLTLPLGVYCLGLMKAGDMQGFEYLGEL
jgi:hypothetical protein